MEGTTFPTVDYYEFSGEAVTDAEGVLYMEDCPPAGLPLSSVCLPAVYFLIFLAGVSGNVFVIAVLRGKRQKDGRLVDTFVLNLAAADLVFVLTLPLWAVSALQEHRWAFGDGLCKLSSYVIAVNRFSNVFFLTCMSADRYLAVVRMLDSRFLRTARCVKLTCAGVWALSLALGTPSLLFRRARDPGGEGLPFCVEDRESRAFQVLSLASFFLGFVLPLLVIVFCYGSILAQLRRPGGGSGGKAQAEARRRRRHSLKIVFAIVAAFLLSWIPFNVLKVVLIGSRMRGVALSCGAMAALETGLVLSSCLAFFSSCANPAIYLCLDRHFRRRARRLCLGCSGRPGPRWGGSASSTSFRTSES
ncbi:probable G-protein coupled receptor 25 [Anguilla rostrata]|uniref:probable G-protein coupled receptor 25 n=1 Tax=Anguilla rostrata TaxID=7938 RepID=UPI0030CEFC07